MILFSRNTKEILRYDLFEVLEVINNLETFENNWQACDKETVKRF